MGKEKTKNGQVLLVSKDVPRFILVSKPTGTLNGNNFARVTPST
jgi:hypothetical protein